MALSNFELALALSNLVGSALSSLGSAFIIFCYVFFPVKKHHRHLLILNLATADCINATTNVISGSVVLATGPLSKTPACIANGFIEQLSAQATDTSILAISIVTILIVTASHDSSWTAKSGKSKERFIVVVCMCTWVMPVLTSFIALGKGYYTAVSGNWCWLTPEPAYVRYVLTHGWRFLFIFIEIGLYSYLHIYIRRWVKVCTLVATHNTSHSRMNLRNGFHDLENASGSIQMDEFPFKLAGDQSSSLYVENKDDLPSPRIAIPSLPAYAHDQQKQISRMLLLNAYPIAYILLWIPGICNRLVEASGHSSRVLQIMQASTQFVGFANALTYGWNENVAKSLRETAMKRMFQ
ncbi:G protein-coupled glucose receptor regulating Gpa2-domain-containing protein [Armillaria novae-zelandiae]|uniref:G protein-coupled glucose receptor regulating Gpa2-domain-containing protein n=1 Tax=Armillaria novae-zelandiae TaxID=153914 RepID=A0AA39NT47_9AGAR|nr:G protein-coupled glucose receptor regulating Gpa2-domain-containing protein [Armillaria novae-zelandiae]